MPVRLIIYDLDGTLIDSIEDITDALNFALAPFHLSPLCSTEVSGMIGEGVVRLVENALTRYGLDRKPGPIVTRYTERYNAHLTDKTAPYPHAGEVLKSLGSIRQAIISNKSEALSRNILTALDLSDYFDILLGADTIEERKPSPAPILHVLSTLHIPAGDTLMVGDSEIDVMAGKAAGVRTVAVTHGYGRPGFEREADFAIPTLSDLPSLVSALNR